MDDRLYRELLPLLDMPTQPNHEGRVWSYCPGHADGTKHKRTPAGVSSSAMGRSLSLHPTRGLQCFARCTEGDGFMRVLELLRGRSPGTGPRPVPRSNNTSPRTSPRTVERWHDPRTGEDLAGIPAHAKLAAEYEYRDHTGKLIAVKGRWEYQAEVGERSKTFKWHLPGKGYASSLTACPKGPDGTPEHYAGCPCVAGSAIPLWGAELLPANPEARVWFTEGEKACEAVRARQELAVCLGGGSGQKDFGKSLEILAGRDVILWQDNDVVGGTYMSTLRKALKGIARSVIIIAPPGGPKSDAYDWFAAGGTVEGALEHQLGGVAVDLVGDDHFRVRIPMDAGIGQVVFDFEAIEQMRGSIESELSVSAQAPTFDPDPYGQRVNILSASARESIVRVLEKQYGKTELNWTRLVGTAWARVRQTIMDIDLGMHAEDLPDPEAEQFVVDGFISKGATTVLFGDGESVKTYTAIGLAAAVASGRDFVGRAVSQMPVLYIDWETDTRPGQAAWRRRKDKLYRGMWIDESEWRDIPLHYRPARGMPLPQMVESLQRYIARRDIGMIVIDSAMPACGGSPEDAVTTLAFFNAIAKLDVTAVILSHIPKSSLEKGYTPDRPFGSQVWHNQPRRTWHMKRSETFGSEPYVEVSIMCKKNNDGPRPMPIGLRLNFEEEAAWFEYWDASTGAEYNAALPPWKQAYNFIQAYRESGRPPTLEEIASAVNVPVREMYGYLNEKRAKRIPGSHGVFIDQGGKEGAKDQLWDLHVNPEDRQTG